MAGLENFLRLTLFLPLSLVFKGRGATAWRPWADRLTPRKTGGPENWLRPIYFISEDRQTLLSGATKMTLKRFFSASFLASSKPTAIKAVAQPSASKQ